MDEYEGLRRFGREVDKLAGKMRETRASSEVEKMKCGPDGREKASYESLHGATGIERLRGLTEFWSANRLEEIVGQIEREHVSRMRVLAVITDMERHVSGVDGMEDSPVARWARELREALKSDASDERETQKPSCDDDSETADVTSEALKVTRDLSEDVHGMTGIERLRELAKKVSDIGNGRKGGYVVTTADELTDIANQIDREWDDVYMTCRSISAEGLASADWVSMHGGLEAVNKRLMPPGMEWVRWDDGKPVTYNDAPDDVVGLYLALDGSGYALMTDLPYQLMSESGERVKRPAKVLAGDNEPLYRGEYVWHEDGTKLMVLDFLHEEDDETIVKVSHVSGPTNWSECRSLSLTHECPDSWERLEEDAMLTVDKYRERHRLEKRDGITWPKLVKADLVRRAKALAERGK